MFTIICRTVNQKVKSKGRSELWGRPAWGGRRLRKGWQGKPTQCHCQWPWKVSPEFLSAKMVGLFVHFNQHFELRIHVFLEEMCEILRASPKPDPQSQQNSESDLPGMIKNLLYNQSQVLWVKVAFWPIRCWPEDGCTYLLCYRSNWLQAHSTCVKSEVGNVLCSG